LDKNLNEEESQMTSVAFGVRPPEGITVVGEASRETTPDAVALFFEIHTAAPAAALAVQENSMKARQISQAIHTATAGRSEIQTGGIAVWPIPPAPLLSLPITPALALPSLAAFGSQGVPMPMMPSMMPAMTEPVPMVYEAVSSLKAELQDTNRVGEVVDAVSKVGGSVVVAVRFLAQEEASVRRSLLEEAVRETRQTADSLAAAVGKTAGNPISISEEDFGAYPPQRGNGNGDQRSSGGSLGRLALAPLPVRYSARVSVTYQIQ
jgi:uncharacterized protein YggE